MRLKLPHISRIFSAAILWILLLAFLSVNVFAIANYPLAYGSRLSSIFSQPFSWEPHAALAVDLWNQGARQTAVQEVAISQELYAQKIPESRVLGTTTTPDDLFTMWQNAPVQDEQRRQYWEQIIKNYPDYRDGYIQLASLLYTLGKTDEAVSYVRAAQTIDPNNPTIGKILEILSRTTK